MVPSRARYDLCTRVLVKQPHLMTDKADRDKFEKDAIRHTISFFMGVTAIPYQLYCAYMINKDRAKNIKYLPRGAAVTFGSLGYFFYAIYLHNQVEKQIFDKYLGNVTMEGLE